MKISKKEIIDKIAITIMRIFLFLKILDFYSEEEQNDNKVAELISNLGDIYVNDAFSCSHRLVPLFVQFTGVVLPSFFLGYS